MGHPVCSDNVTRGEGPSRHLRHFPSKSPTHGVTSVGLQDQARGGAGSGNVDTHRGPSFTGFL
eukprot:6328160-Pyramimonas_sp.AAC.1